MKTKIQSYLPGDHPWQSHISWFDTIDSTNTRLKELAKEGAPHGTVLIADRQTGGRGRLGRSFQSPGGMGVYMSVLLRYPAVPEELMHLTCAAAVAACDAVAKATGLTPGIKWTNDLVYRKRKLAGILTELVLLPGETAAVIGIGINCCQALKDFDPQIQGFAGSLAMATGKPVDRAQVAAQLILAFSQMDQNLFSCKEDIIKGYETNCITVGQDISLVRGDEIRHGHAIGIEESGALIVRFPDGHSEAISSGEVSVRGMYGYI